VQPVRVGAAVAEVLRDGVPGRVVAVFRRALYVSYPRGLIAVVGTDVEPGPLHAHATALPVAAVGDLLDLAGCAAVWRPPPFPPVDEVVAVLGDVLDHVPDLDLGGAHGDDNFTTLSVTAPRALVAALTAVLRAGGLPALVAALAGRGSGLTPAGDDVLAGVLLVARAAGRPEAELVELAGAVPTHDISRAFLAWAARGQSIAPVHDLVAACARGDVRAARRSRARLAGVGHTSGLDLAYGVLVGCTHVGGGAWRRPAP
jgi:hypothetical protein